jgi:hypothetical protein
MPAAVYSPAPAVKEVAEPLIVQYHGHLKDFNVRIEYVFTDKMPKRGGKDVWAFVRKVTNLNAYLATKTGDADAFFVMVVSEHIWDLLSDRGRKALVDHELCHMGAEVQEKEDGEVVKLTLIPHDMEEFLAINRRWGLWQEEVDAKESKEEDGEEVEDEE